MIGICTDSNAQLPQDLIDRYGIEVVPITIVIEDHEYLEGLHLEVDAFYGLFADGGKPDVQVTDPSPGQFALAYEQLLARGATEILSIHVGLGVTGAIKSARIAARSVGVPVRIVDTGTAGFGVGSCVWAAARAVEHGAGLEEAAGVAEALAPNIRNVFVVGALDLLDAEHGAGATDYVGTPVLSFSDGHVQPVSTALSVGEAVDHMVGWALCQFGPGAPIGVAVGFGDAKAAPLGLALRDGLLSTAEVRDCVLFRVSPSTGAQLGPGAAGVFVFPV